MSKHIQGSLVPPIWFSVTSAARYSGLSRALIYEHIRDEMLVSSTVKRPGRRRGRRLVERASLDRLIEAGIGGKARTTPERISLQPATLPKNDKLGSGDQI